MSDALSEEFYRAREHELAERVSPKRLAHIQGVADTAAALARAYGLDEQKARLAGLLHDWDKGYDDEGIRKRVAELGLAGVLDPFLVENMPQVLHGPTAAAALERRFPEIPADVIRAIRYHTTGVADATGLDKALYIADAIEPTRKFGKVDDLRSGVGKLDLDELYFRVYKFWTMALVERDKVLHPDTIPIWNALAAEKAERKATRKKDKHGKRND